MTVDWPAGKIDIVKLAEAIYQDGELAGREDTLRFLVQLLNRAWERRETLAESGPACAIPRAIFGDRPTPKLGLDQLTDDQALDLCAAIYEEIGCRLQERWWAWLDHKARIEEDYRIRHEAWLLSLNAVREKQVKEMRGRIAAKVEQAIDAGKIKLVEADDEAKLLEAVTAETRIRIIDEFLRKLESGEAPGFTFEAVNGLGILKFTDGTTFERIVTPNAAVALGENLKKSLGM